MAYGKNVPQYPILQFIDGSQFEVLRSSSVFKDNMECLEVVLSPFPWTMDMLGISDKDLNCRDYAHGAITRTYPASKIEILSTNPEKPLMQCWLTFHGTPKGTKNVELAKLFRLTDKLTAMEQENSVLRAENKRLIRENLSYALKFKEFIADQQSFAQPPGHIMLPPDMSEVEMRQKIAKKD